MEAIANFEPAYERTNQRLSDLPSSCMGSRSRQKGYTNNLEVLSCLQWMHTF